jgi:hypothetical protein
MKRKRHTRNYDWLAVSCFFKPYSFTDAKGNGALGCQMLVPAAVKADRIRGLTGIPALPIAPGTITVDSLIVFLDAVFTLHGRPKVGVMIMAEVWMGTSDLLLMPALTDRTRFLAETGESWPEISIDEREHLGIYLRSLGLVLEWATSDRPTLN